MDRYFLARSTDIHIRTRAVMNIIFHIFYYFQKSSVQIALQIYQKIILIRL